MQKYKYFFIHGKYFFLFFVNPKKIMQLTYTFFIKNCKNKPTE